MKNIIKHITLCGLVAVGASMGLSSCEDFLTITPTDKIVEEEFWQDKNDLNNAVMGCYKRMVGSDLLSKYIYWGEERSDNFERSSSLTASSPIVNIMNANLLPTYYQFSWEAMYNAINYCNKVLVHAPEVIEKDESFSTSDWLPIRAEIITLRALSHFYLVRTFGEIPYVTMDYNNDSQELRATQSTQLAVLDSIVSDLESIKNDAMIDYGNTVENKGRVTKKAVYALLADVYLWRASYKAGNNQPFTKVTLPSAYNGEWTEAELASRHEEYSTSAQDDYRKCIEYCDLIIDMAIQEKRDYLNKSGWSIGGNEVEIELKDLLESNEVTGNLLPSQSMGSNAYEALFGIGNSEESIFELQVDGVTYSNTMITDLYYNISGSREGSLTGATALFEGIESTPNTLSPASVFTKTDYRRWEYLRYTSSGQTAFNISKYVQTQVAQSVGTTSIYLTDNSATNIAVTSTLRSPSNLDANWIFYRLSEIYLFKAEAMSQLYSDEEDLEKAFGYVREVFKRSNPYAYYPNNAQASNDSLNFRIFATPEGLESLVMAERQREFIGEGKRWYDLVRYALRRGNTSAMLDMLARKYTNSGAVRAKLADMQSLFSPVYNNELKNNTWLYQNSVWHVNETSSRTDEL